MAVEKVKDFFTGTELEGKVIELPESSATVELAAQALDTEPDRIAKTLSYLLDDCPILIVASGMARVDNRKFKDTFHKKAKMIPFDKVDDLIGHPPGGVCPFACKEGVKVYLDVSLKKYDTVFPAAGSGNSAVETTIAQLEKYTGFPEWVDVCQESKDPLAWEEIRTEHVVQDEWIDFRRSAFRFPDGSEFEPYYSYSRRDYVVIVASDTEGKYLCVRQYRQGIRQVTTEFTAGGIERKDGREYGADKNLSAEDALDAAKRELLEETGYCSDEWKKLLTVPSNATIADNYAHLFLAENCRKVADQDLDDTEFLNVVRYSAEELEEMIAKGEFQQAVHILAWLLSRRE